MTVIIWEPAENNEGGHAVFGHASRHPWKLPLASEALGYRKLAALFGCGQSTVRDIVQYVTRYSA